MGQTRSPNLITGLDAAVIDQLNTIVTQTENPVSVIGPGVPPRATVQSVDSTNNSVIVSPGADPQSAAAVYKFG